VGSAVAGGCNFDVSLASSVGNTFPVDLVSDSGEGELTFEVSARSNLQVVVVSLVIMAMNVLSVDIDDMSGPVLEDQALEVAVVEVEFA